jgi:hypothetical protein
VSQRWGALHNLVTWRHRDVRAFLLEKGVAPVFNTGWDKFLL